MAVLSGSPEEPSPRRYNMINMLTAPVVSHARYDCPNPECTHTKRVLFTCKSRSCPSCGKKATYQWSAKQQAILPATKWPHIVMTMPKELWRLFALNRQLLSDLSPFISRKLHSNPSQQSTRNAGYLHGSAYLWP